MRHQACPKTIWAALWLIPVICAAQENPFAGKSEAVAEGHRVFSVSCASCHGRNGEGAQGQAEGMQAPDLTRGVFKAGRRDSDLFRVISEGVRGTEMPSFKSMGPDQIWRLVSFVKSLSAGAVVLHGNPANGETLFWGKGNCGHCHQMGTRGNRYGPDLSRGGRRGGNAENIKKSIVDPNADITPGFAVITVVTRDGKKITGLERWMDNFSARLVDQTGTEKTYLRDEVTSVTREFRSMMPDTYGKTFNATELDDLVAYIVKTRSEANAQ